MNRNSEYIILHMKYIDIDDVVKLHLSTFKDFFLTMLGQKFLVQFYKFFVDDYSGIRIVIKKNNSIIGFVVGTTDPEKFYKRALKRRIFKFGLAALPTLIKNPAQIVRIVSALNRSKDAKLLPGDCELVSIGVDPQYYGVGIGKILDEEFCKEAKGKNKYLVRLNTDKNKNEYVNKFYINRGYYLYKSYSTLSGREMNIYLKKLSNI